VTIVTVTKGRQVYVQRNTKSNMPTKRIYERLSLRTRSSEHALWP